MDMNIWIVGKNLMKHHDLIKKIFIGSFIKKILLIKAIHMLKKSLNNLN